jgi:cell division protein FtsB
LSSGRERVRQLAMVVFGAGAAWFAVQGGEFGTADLVRQRSQRVRLDRQLDSLQRVVDSLKRHKARVLTDARTQERIAREEFGMVRGKELLYRFAEPDSL